MNASLLMEAQELPFPVLPLSPFTADASGSATREFLSGIQGGIVAERGRGDHGALILWRFADSLAHEANAAALRAVASLATSAADQLARSGDAAVKSLSVALSGTGLRACGLSPATAAFSDTENFFPPDGAGVFDEGQRAEAGAVLHDPADPAGRPSTWEPVYQDRSDGVWIVGRACPRALAAAIAAIETWGREHGIATHAVETGATWRDAAGVVREPFGFADGIAGPKFFAGEGRAGPGNDVPLEEIFLSEGVHRGGTFLVFRKLEQHVRAFRTRHSVREATELVGRSPDGVPLVGATFPAQPTSPCNDPAAPVAANSSDASDDRFDFAADPRGARCPFHAHIRRANPRGGEMRARGEAPRRLPIVRRPWVFGRASDLADPAGAEGGVGLLFLAYLRSLENFRTMQGDWLYRRNFPVAGVERPDGLLFGEFTDDRGVRRRWVEPRGGEYFYVPSLAWLRSVRPARPVLSAPDSFAFNFRPS